jgi:serine-type D-Ala-D-Ala carboxypeptidase (penicillin-binding protein 5/6)
MQGPGRGLSSLLIRVAVAAAALTVAFGAAPALAAKGPELPARSWLLVDVRDGTTLAAEAPKQRAPVASATKLMTAYAARRDLPLSKRVVAPPYEALAAESLVGLRAAERIAVRDLLYGLLLASGNDAAVALAEAAAGSEPRFVAQMNRDAKRLGLRNTSYANPIGLDEPGNYSSARDLVTLATELREDPFFRRVLDTPEATLRTDGRTIRVTNRNLLVRTVPWVNGVKTGYTLGADYVLVGSGTRKGVTLVSAVLGAPTESERDAATLELLEYGFSQYRRERLIKPGERLAAPEVRYQDTTMPLVAGRELTTTLRRDQRVKTDLRVPAEVEGPIERGDRIGSAKVTVDGQAIGTVPLLAARTVGEADIGDRVDSAIPGGRLAAWVLITAALVGAVLLFGWAISRRRGTR